ncbi:hypothetical protein [Nocardioides nanhaiensis]|uniref:hypothetical protein n=1 Tax=Nocardioides nanhaiensis TaxID=1476871 RepID=UPI0031E7C6E7
MTSARRPVQVLWSTVTGAVAGWSVGSHAVATDNARAAATECSRLRVEREEVARYLAEVARPAAVGVAADGLTRARSRNH